MLLAQLGYYTQDEFLNIVYKATEDSDYDSSKDKFKISYDELIGKEFYWYPNNQVFTKASESNPLAAIQPFSYSPVASSSWEGGVKLKVTAILQAKENIQYGCLTSGFYYTENFSKMIIQDSLTSEIVDYISNTDSKMITSLEYNGIATGVTYKYNISYTYGGEVTNLNNIVGYVGKVNQMSSIMGSMTGMNIPASYELSLRSVGGDTLPESIAIYPVNFELKDLVTEYLDLWNSEDSLTINGVVVKADERSDVTYSDNLEIIISLINTMIDIVTYALVAFTSLSLVVSTVMIAIITYVSVIERVKEIGVIRALGGRKKDVSRLFNAETFIIGGLSGLVGIGVTYLISFILNMFVGSLSGIYTIATLTPTTAAIMVGISIGLTLISGLVPAKLAAKKDPVDALRSE